MAVTLRQRVNQRDKKVVKCLNQKVVKEGGVEMGERRRDRFLLKIQGHVKEKTNQVKASVQESYNEQ